MISLIYDATTRTQHPGKDVYVTYCKTKLHTGLHVFRTKDCCYTVGHSIAYGTFMEITFNTSPMMCRCVASISHM